ncbi:uncharacterized protein Triagg1_7573 [Trichoderma aggressivum f. europaeum]|uniref:F-box domain-containing protein n=1 Tax=Trichoderma aggressivum f. europaeum TaxID=173218 RepID=A0AAE1I9E5_9HYPO|nr:hypothetical protein Triagg1_7573 [Trichoderma aggressivum f. europaeum]
MATMASSFPLMSFPEEIIENICRQLADYPRLRYTPKSLSDLCQASKALNRIGTPVLYSCFDASERLKKLADFLRTITLRPELGALVQDLYLNAFYWTEFDKSHTEAFERAATRLGVSLDGWMEDNPWEAISQLVIAYTPNVRSMEVTAHEVYCDDGVGAFTLLEKMAAQVPRQVSLPHLRRLCVGHDDCRQISLGYFGGILELAPSIREIKCDPIYGFHGSEKLMNDRMILDNVTRLYLKGGHISRRQLNEIVSRCQALEYFKYTYHSIYAGLEEECVTPREVIDVLRDHHHNDTLRSVYIDLRWRERRSTDELSFSGLCTDGDQILSLKDFSRLESFHVDGSSVLFPAVQTPGYRTDIVTNMLPGSIRRFQLTNAQGESVANVMTLATSLTEFPFLEEVVLTGNGTNGPLGDVEEELDGSEMGLLRKVLDESGIRLEDTWSDDEYD